MKDWKYCLKFGVLLVLIFVASRASATNYYVDYANGNDSNNGTSKSSPWQHAPGMNGASGAAQNTPLNPGDNVILKGCVTWPNSAFTWTIPYGGNSSANIYYGVDKTWWDNTVAGCGSAWNRPIFDLGNANPTDNLNRIIIYYSHPYVTLDNFEITNIAANWNPINQSTSVFSCCAGNTTVQNMYVHGWHNPCFSIGTGDLSSGSSTVNNYVPFSYSPAASAINNSWGVSGACKSVQLQAPNGGIPLGNNTPTVTSVSGSGPYTITFTNSSGGANKSCKGCLIQVGQDFLLVFAGIEGPTNNDVAQDNVIDGSDTAEVQMNPYGDCGLAEGNNNMCVASGTVLWRVPNIFRNNVIRFVENGAVGECSEWSGNLIEYVRLSTNPTAHTNVIECLDDNPVNGATLFYNNVIRHGTNPNPNTPTGVESVGVGAIWYTPVAGETAYLFNNVFYDVLQNSPFERASRNGTAVVFNNSAQCGVSWSLSNYCEHVFNSSDVYENNHFITSISPALNGSGFSQSNNLTQTPSAASSQGFSVTSNYALVPTSSKSATISAGKDISAICSAIAGANAAAGNACQSDTAYAVGYDPIAHAVIGPGRATVARGGTPDIGAYQALGTPGAGQPPPPPPTTPPAPPSGLTAIVN